MKITAKQVENICESYDTTQDYTYQQGIELVLDILDVDYKVIREWGNRYLVIYYESGDAE